MTIEEYVNGILGIERLKDEQPHLSDWLGEIRRAQAELAALLSMEEAQRQAAFEQARDAFYEDASRMFDSQRKQVERLKAARANAEAWSVTGVVDELVKQPLLKRIDDDLAHARKFPRSDYADDYPTDAMTWWFQMIEVAGRKVHRTTEDLESVMARAKQHNAVAAKLRAALIPVVPWLEEATRA